MSEIDFETQVKSMAMRLEYPRTPDIAGSVTKRLHLLNRARLIPRRLAWSLTIILVIFFSLMLIPSARASILEFIQIGVVRIFPRTVEPTMEVIRTVTPQQQTPITATPLANNSPLPTISPTPETLLHLLRRMAGETTLAEAQAKTNFPILLPTYPADLGEPDHVFIQDAGGNMVILVWLDPQQPDKVLMSLYMIPNGSWIISKFEPQVLQETQVHGHRAIWTEGPYPLMLRNGNTEFTQLVDGHVLIWTDGDLTYRLETTSTIAEAVKIAESLKPVH